MPLGVSSYGYRSRASSGKGRSLVSLSAMRSSGLFPAARKSSSFVTLFLSMLLSMREIHVMHLCSALLEERSQAAKGMMNLRFDHEIRIKDQVEVTRCGFRFEGDLIPVWEGTDS